MAIPQMTPKMLFDELDMIVKNKIMDTVLILGESGVGKSQIIDQIGAVHNLPVYSVLWGQLTPVDARGVPVPQHETKETVFYTPDFWPKKGPGIIFMDEYNMAATTMQAIGQQLLLDRKFGSYKVPDDVFIFAAGNRKVDKAAVNDIPFPVLNRVAHYEVVHDFESWEFWAYANEQDPDIIGFLKFRSELLHKPAGTGEDRAWPSPRTWAMANRRVKARMNIGPVVGEAAASEFQAFVDLKGKMPDIKQIADGKGDKINFPDDPSLKYAVMSELTYWGMKDWPQFQNCFNWFLSKAKDEPEWTSMFILDSLRIMGRNDQKKNAMYMGNLMKMPAAKSFIEQYVELTTGRKVKV